MAAAARRRLRGVLFDMDGTITQPGAIDFARIRERCGVPKGSDILAHVAGQPHLEAIVVEEEEAGLQRMKLMEDCHEVFEWLCGLPLRRGLITRNNTAAMARTVALLGRGEDTFHVMLSRAFTPCKPHPAPILHICEQWGYHPGEVIMVGDAIDDVQCAKRAGAVAVLIGGDHTCKYYQEALPHADYTVRSLTELKHLVAKLMADEPEGAAAAAAEEAAPAVS